MKSVLVTGATGFVGSQVLMPLINKNFKIHATYFTEKPRIHHANIFWEPVNLHDPQAVKSLLQKIQTRYLLHLAWYTNPADYWISSMNLEWLHSSLNLLNAFIQMGGKRIVLVGTCAEYDWKYGSCNELTPCSPRLLYGTAKYALYLLSQSIAVQQNVSLAWGRLFYLFGMNEYPQRLIPAVIRSLLNRQPFQVMNGHQIHDYLYVKDVADALVTLLDSDVSGPVNVASGNPMTIHELITLIAHKLDGAKWINYQTDSLSRLENRGVTADITRLSTEVKWFPQYSLDNALNETIAWWSNEST